ncbi:ABC transporter ATP-binding protein [Conexibacter arvalis]|uniref:Oligopeptide/dipeptide ABC transporter ATP-binding protein n=1 Tax=Conexibacter arvalis TaxID=912552 RepID=A0A840I8Z3_9ACTN|nr:ABC transporter ATP-binding protein [Conexibacter arvalis]MBB4661336.1 oligopeptide/dipeptide ABC transporter ATP-binding protein [Conexibacter arvalis]
MPPSVTSETTAAPVLELRELRKTFAPRGLLARRRGVAVPAVDGIDLRLEQGSTTALVGESGSGKSTLARLILHLHKADSGEILFGGEQVQGLSERDFRRFRADVQMVFQNPLTSFDPMHTIGSSIKETMRLRPPAGDPDARVRELLEEAGLSARFADLRPRDVSGGELQRAGIARALSVTPKLVVMDEPTSALDMSIQGQVLELLARLQRDHDLTYLIVTHDLRTVRMVAERVVVMYLGQVVEEGPTHEVFDDPRHPYTRGLLYAHDLADRDAERDANVRIRGSLRYPTADERGCRLVGRCPLAVDRCREPQPLAETGPDRRARCWRGAQGPLDTAGA